jgi:hypothetical protein
LNSQIAKRTPIKQTSRYSSSPGAIPEVQREGSAIASSLHHSPGGQEERPVGQAAAPLPGEGSRTFLPSERRQTVRDLTQQRPGRCGQKVEVHWWDENRLDVSFVHMDEVCLEQQLRLIRLGKTLELRQ